MSNRMFSAVSFCLAAGLVACGDDGSGTGGEGGDQTSTTSTTTTSSSSSSSAKSSSSSQVAASTATATGSTSASASTGAMASPECTSYCTEFVAHCTTIPDVEVYTDDADCLATCAGFPHGAAGTFQGDSVECRLDHLTFDPNPGPGYYELHCFHAQEHPTAQCL